MVADDDRQNTLGEPEDDGHSVTETQIDCCSGPISSSPVVPQRFRLLEKLGQGGMGVVHRAYDCELGREVALKSINVRRPDDLYHLKREFRLLAELRHPNLVRLYELFADGCHAFFTMELLLGEEFHSFVRRPPAGGQPPCDYARLRSAARDLASALAAVHAAGMLHRDVKPSNILVTPEGRVVLFDFGLGAPLSPSLHKTEGAGVLLGTRGYISPEQARGESLGPGADWYSFGVTLFEAATGRLPFGDSFKALLAERRADESVRIRKYAPDAPADLDDLIARLLDPVVERRPSEAGILEALGVSRVVPPTQTRSSRPPRPHPLRDRPAAAASLAQAMERVRRGRSAILSLHGGAGVGKSELARSFVDEAESQGALVLRGRCRSEESVAFNALDEVVDDLSQTLEHMSYSDLISVLPPHVAALPRLFPVLGRLEAKLEGSFPSGQQDDSETLQRARAALKDLLAGLANGRPLVIWIDDAQWGDRASGELLRELLHPAEGPPILLLVSYRNDEPGGTLQALRDIDAPGAAFDVPIQAPILPPPMGAWCHL